MSTQNPLPIQPVEKPILGRPYDEPNDHWIYNEDGLTAPVAAAKPVITTRPSAPAARSSTYPV